MKVTLFRVIKATWTAQRSLFLVIPATLALIVLIIYVAFCFHPVFGLIALIYFTGNIIDAIKDAKKDLQKQVDSISFVGIKANQERKK